MKERSKYVLEGAIVELTKNEYDRYLSINDILTQIDSQQYLGSVTKEEANECANILNRILDLKANEITLLQTLSRDMFAFIRPEVGEGEAANKIEGQIDISELSKERAMKGIRQKINKVEEYKIVDSNEPKKEE